MNLRKILADKIRYYRYRIEQKYYSEEAKKALNYLRSISKKPSFKKRGQND